MHIMKTIFVVVVWLVGFVVVVCFCFFFFFFVFFFFVLLLNVPAINHVKCTSGMDLCVCVCELVQICLG